MGSFKISGHTKLIGELSTRVESALANRQKSLSSSYTQAEIERVSMAARKLVGANINLPTELLESIRAAATLANSELRPNPDFTSHRPFIGWIIVTIKKLTWPLVRFHLHRHFDNQSELNRWTLYNQVKLYEAAIGKNSPNKIQ